MITEFHVIPVPEGWTVQVEGRSVIGPVQLQAAAEQLAIETAQAIQRSAQDATVLVHDRDGGVRASYTFNYSPHDPKPLPPVG